MYRVFRHYVSRSFLLLGLGEALISVAALYAGILLRFGDIEVAAHEIGVLHVNALMFALVMLVTLSATGLYKPDLRYGRAGILLRIGTSLALAFVLMSLIFYAYPPAFIGRGAFGLAFLFTGLGLLTSRTIFHTIARQDTLKRRILVLGAGKKAGHITHLRRKVDRRGFLIVAYAHIPGEHDVVDAALIAHIDVPLLEYCLAQRVDEIVVAMDDRRKSFPYQELLDCKINGIDVVELLTFFERQTGKIRLDLLHPSWLILSDGFQHGSSQIIAKRIFDILVSGALLTAALPIMLLTVLAIKLEEGPLAPVFYRQVRVGQNWHLFQIAKFRSMRLDAEKFGAQWAQKDDPRVTRVGRFIRKTRIDELPQLFNVIKGEMSFVGPRPERPMFVEQFSAKIPYYAERHRVKPGITGWAQVRYPYGSSEQDAIEKLQFDLYYVKNYSVLLDLLILLQTAEVILWGRGAR